MRTSLILLLLIFISGGTSGDTNQGKLVFRDDFSDPKSGWEQQKDQEYVTDYADGEYQIKNAVDHQITNGIFQRSEISDGDFTVTARKITGPDDIRFGLLARYRGNDRLEAAILPEGRCLLWYAKYENNKQITKPGFQSCPSVKRGNEANQLHLVVKGTRAIFYVNGGKVAEIDNVGTEGRQFGLLASSTTAGSDVRFDNFELREAQ